MNSKTISLSPAQIRILLAELGHPGTRAYHTYGRIQYSPGEAEWVKKALPYVFQGNFSLRVTQSGTEGYVQYASDEPVAVTEMDVKDAEDVEGVISEKKKEGLPRLFDAPLYRIFLMHTESETVLFVIFHHLISDGTTIQKVLPRTLRKVMDELKAGEEPQGCRLTYDSYIRRLNEYLSSEEAEEDRKYWIRKLSGFTGIGYQAAELSKGVLSCELPDRLTEDLKKFQTDHRISPFVLGMGAAFLYFAASRAALGSGLRDMVWEISVNGRYFGEDLADETGMYVETLPLRFSYDPKRSFLDSILYVKSVMKEALSHAKMDTNAYFGELKKSGVDLRALTSFSAVSNSLSGESAEAGTPDETDVPFHIRVNFNKKDADGLQTLIFEYNSSLFKRGEIKEIRDGIVELLEQAARNPDALPADMHLLPSWLIIAESFIERNLAAADEPVYLQSGMNRGEGHRESGTRHIGEIRDQEMTDGTRLGAAFLDVLARFGMTKEILVGIKFGKVLFPFGMSVDTNDTAANFMDTMISKLKSPEWLLDYPIGMRTDIHFAPSVVFSFETPAEIKDGIMISVYMADRGTVIKYDADMYSREYMKVLLESIRTVYDNLPSGKLLKDIPLVPKPLEEHRITLANEGTVNDVFERMAKASPDKTILTAADRTLSFGELDSEANRLGHALMKRGVTSSDRVLLLMRRTSALVVSVFGVLKAGAVFITMDPDYPRERLDQIIEDSEAALVITDIQSIRSTMDNAVLYSELMAEADSSRPDVSLTPESMCFIIYTSGTTGKPKGVVLSHMGITNYVAADPKNEPIWYLREKCSKMLCLSSVSFIVFLREIFGTILNGIPVVLCNEEQAVNPMAIAELIKTHGIDAMGSTPTRLLQYMDVPQFVDALDNIRLMIVGGEGFPGRLFTKLRKYSACEIYNSYGPTEVTIASHQKRMESDRVSAGFPMLNVWERIADVDGNELPPYAAGELYVGGAGVAIGYFHDEELTAEHFPVIDGVRYCNTGDLAYRDKRGEVFVLGRNDGMIKLRGLRIELEEVENTIGNYPGIVHARVVVRTINGTEHLCAFYTCRPGAEPIKSERIRTFVAKKLPPYMVPSYYTYLHQFPLTPNGKVAVKALKELEVDTSERIAFEAPDTKEEEQLFGIVAGVLGTDRFGVKDDLFALGLTSLTMISVISGIYETWGLTIRVTDFMELKSVEDIAEKITELLENLEAANEEQRKNEVREYYPLTDNQLGIYLDCMAHPESIGYHLPNILRLDQSVDPERLKNAVLRAVIHHKYLKVTLETKGGEVLQRRDDALPVRQAISIKNVDSFTDKMAEELAARPFDLNGQLLFRFGIFVTPDEVVLVSVFHHLIVDGGSLNILFRDIAAAYDGRDLSDQGIDGYQVSINEKMMINSPAYLNGRDYYAGRLSIIDEPTVLTPNLKGDADKGTLGVERFGLDPKLVDDLCRKYGISQNVLFMSSLYVVLTKFVSDDRLLLATVSSGRLDPSLRNTVALLVRTMPLVLQEKRDINVRELFDHVGRVWMDTLANQIYPFTKIAGEFDLHPEFFYTYHGRIYEEISLGGKTYERGRIAYDSLRYKTMVNVVLEDQYYIQIEYNDALYTAEYIRCFARCMGDLIRKWAEQLELSGVKIRDISLAKEAAGYKLTPLKEVMVHQTFERMAASFPERRILTSCGETLTYDQLNRRANRIANALKKRGVKEGGRVVLLLPRTCNLIAAMLGSLKAGAAYIPMDVEYPKERVTYVLENSGADFVITAEDMPRAVSPDELLSEENEANPPITVDPDRTCYMIYTSGSTGRPKGVAVSHMNLSNLCVPVPENNYFYTRNPRPESVIQTATVSFDASILDIMPPLLNGIRVVFANDEENRNVNELVDLIRREKPTMLGDMTPSRLMQYLNSPEFAAEISHFEACSVGGEAFLPALYDRLRALSDLDIYNSYGPTETTVHSNTRLITRENMMSVGKALYNVICEIRDIDGKMLPDGVMGELYIGGYGVSKGYHNMPEKTAESFVTIDGMRYFRSGDYAYKLPDEEIVVMGRRDGQIKLRGLRIEIGEVEGSIEAYKGVKKAAVVIRKIGKIDHLCGYYTADAPVDENALRAFLSSRLTPYMVPTVLMQLKEMPFTPNGKLDRKNLPEPVIKKEYVEPATHEEGFFCDIFEQVLDMENVGATSDFFAIGGSSLLATQLTILASNGGYDIKFRDVFDNPTPRKLAAFVTGSKKEENSEENTVLKDIDEYDYTAIHERLKKNSFENYTSGSRKKLSKVLLTGATGFLGIHVLRELIEQDDVVVYCMLRGNKGKSGADRLKNRLFYYFDEEYAGLFGIRLIVRDGAITNEGDFAAFDDDPIDTIINCAASVKHFSSGTDIYDTNVTGVKNGLAYAKKRGLRYIHISTTSTAGEILLDGRHEVFTYDEQTLYRGQILDNQYLSSKFLSERVVLEAAAGGMDTKVIRVGNLMARSSDGIFQINFRTNGFISRLRAYVTLNEMPYKKMLQRAEFSPIDITAKAIVALASSPKECCLFNCFNNHTVVYGDILDVATREGLCINPVTDAEFEKSLHEAMLDETKREGISGLITTVGMGVKKERLLTAVNNDYTIMALYHENIFWPILSRQYLGSFIDFLKGLGFWEK